MSECAEYVDALDHIARTARASRTQSRRLRWIAGRAECALNGGDWRELQYPKRVRQPEMLETEIEQLQQQSAELAADLLKADRLVNRLSGSGLFEISKIERLVRLAADNSKQEG